MTNTDTHPLLSANNTEQSIQSVDSTDTSNCTNILAWHGGFEVSRVTIRSRGGAAGSVQFDAPENHYRQSKKHLAQKVQMFLGGIAAEQAVLDSYGQGGLRSWRASVSCYKTHLHTMDWGMRALVRFQEDLVNMVYGRKWFAKRWKWNAAIGPMSCSNTLSCGCKKN